MRPHIIGFLVPADDVRFGVAHMNSPSGPVGGADLVRLGRTSQSERLMISVTISLVPP
jgi:hypothetical protein